MKKFNFERAYIPDSERELVVQDLWQKWLNNHPDVRQFYGDAATIEKIREHVLSQHKDAMIWKSDVYQVEIRGLKDEEGTTRLLHLSVKRLDREAIHDWRDLQEIKNRLVGPENEGVELYPAESRLVDGANQFHIFVVADPSYRFPFGFTERMVSETAIGKSVNRPFEEEA